MPVIIGRGIRVPIPLFRSPASITDKLSFGCNIKVERRLTHRHLKVKKSLSVRYAEVMRLRQAIMEAQSATASLDDHPARK
jgi:hypothetical protein